MDVQNSALTSIDIGQGLVEYYAATARCVRLLHLFTSGSSYNYVGSNIVHDRSKTTSLRVALKGGSLRCKIVQGTASVLDDMGLAGARIADLGGAVVDLDAMTHYWAKHGQKGFPARLQLAPAPQAGCAVVDDGECAAKLRACVAGKKEQ